jgi:hypothetical protein
MHSFIAMMIIDLTLVHKMIYTLHSAVAVRLGRLYNWGGRRSSCTYANREHKSVARVALPNNMHRRIGKRNVCLEAAMDSNRICSDLL